MPTWLVSWSEPSMGTGVTKVRDDDKTCRVLWHIGFVCNYDKVWLHRSLKNHCRRMILLFIMSDSLKV